MKQTVLLVDDELEVLEGLQRSLRREPYRLLLAQSAEEALNLLVSQAIDVVVSDENMPGINGTELLARIREHRPETIRIVLTGCRDFDVAMRAINQGEVHRFFSKPCDTRELAQAIRQSLQQKELLAQSRRLLGTVRRQAAILDELESLTPGLTEVTRDAEGYILIDDPSTNDLESFLKEVEAEIGLCLLKTGAHRDP